MVHSVTTAARSRALDIDERRRRYLWTMGFRTVCFVLAIIAQGWLRWSLAAFAIVLPFIAVLLANAAGPRTAGRIQRVDEGLYRTHLIEK